MDEGPVVDALAAKLRIRNQKFPKGHEKHLGLVFTRKNPASSPTIDLYLRELHGGLGPPLQPEIDIILKNDNDIRAVEVKVFHLDSNNRLSRSYYEGIDQALALLNFGFDRVALWHIFDGNIDQEKLKKFGSAAHIFIRKVLNLPIDFTAMYLWETEGDCRFTPTQPIFDNSESYGVQDVRLRAPIDDPEQPFDWVSVNPLLENPRIKSVRAALLDWLNKREAEKV